jgi:hypothetical protein
VISFIFVLMPFISLRISMRSEAILCIDCIRVLTSSSTFFCFAEYLFLSASISGNFVFKSPMHSKTGPVSLAPLIVDAAVVESMFLICCFVFVLDYFCTTALQLMNILGRLWVGFFRFASAPGKGAIVHESIVAAYFFQNPEFSALRMTSPGVKER